VVSFTKNELQGLIMLLFSTEFSDYGTTIIYKLSLALYPQ